jgi:hypothetical protein
MNQQPPLISRTSALFAQSVVAYCAVAAVAGVIGVGLNLGMFFFGIYPHMKSEPFDSITIWRSMTGGGRVAFIVGFLLAIWTPIVLGARGVCGITFHLLARREPSLAKVFIDMAQFLPTVIVYSFLFGVPVLVASSFFVFPALLVGSFFTLVIPAGINECANLFQALKRGFTLSDKVYGKILLTAVACVALMGLALTLRVLLLDSLITGPQMRVLAIRMMMIYVPGLLVLILANICFTLLYLEARAKETSSSHQDTATASSSG